MITEIIEVLAKITEMDKNNIPEEEAAETIQRESKYNKNTIAAAYSWLHEKNRQDLNYKALKNNNESKSIRMLSNDEVRQVGIRNYEYLLHLYNIGLLTNNDFEEIMDELELFPEESVKTENINILILSKFLDLDKWSLPGSRHLLYSTDNIN
jgi:uncharacterized protein Smg (DUF494 family)